MNTPRVSDIGEFELIERLRCALPRGARQGNRLLLAIGDDAAVARISPDEHMVVSSDTLNADVHFRLDWTSWADLGHKALAVNLSDLAAMGATPILATINLGLTGDEPVPDLEVMYRAMGVLAEDIGMVIGGGDITRSPGGLSITITVIGETTNQQLLRRDAGQPGDQIWVTGTIGAASAGLRLLEMDDDDERSKVTTAAQLIRALHRPVPRLAAGTALLRIGVLCAMDLSDGLAGDLHKLMAASGVDAELELASLPIPAAVRAIFREEATDLALRGGDDYELLFTAAPVMASTITEALSSAGVPGVPIGWLAARAGDSPVLTGVLADGTRRLITAKSFDHFLTG